MTFPDDYKVVGNRAAVHRQLGNAVPVEFGRVVLRSLLEQLGHLDAHRQTPGGQLAAF
jgi:DNA (cytosine-5)-methyltransferase 1